MTSELDAKYHYEMKFNIFIETLLNAPGNTDEMNTLLCQKKIASNIELDTVKTNREAFIKQQDETNVVLDYQKQDGRTSSGIIIPEFIPQELRDQAGNIVKELKAQNLIT